MSLNTGFFNLYLSALKILLCLFGTLCRTHVIIEKQGNKPILRYLKIRSDISRNYFVVLK